MIIVDHLSLRRLATLRPTPGHTRRLQLPGSVERLYVAADHVPFRTAVDAQRGAILLPGDVLYKLAVVDGRRGDGTPAGAGSLRRRAAVLCGEYRVDGN